MPKANCYNCGAQLEYESAVGRREDCPKCNASVHSCKNCQFHDPTSYNECRETSADRVKDKEAANFCDYFALGAQASLDKKDDQLMSAAEALFKK